MVHIVMIRAGPQREEVPQAKRKVVPAVRVDGLEQPQQNPRVHGQDVQVARGAAPDDGGHDGAEAEDHDLDGRGVLGGEAEGGRVLVVDLMNVLVERAPVQRPVRPVVPCVLHDEEDGDLVGHGKEGREGHGGLEPEELRHRVEEPGGFRCWR